MDGCPQCGKKLETPTVRLVQDSCGHRKCRVCLLEDETACKQCNNNEESTTENKAVVSCYTPVITFKKQDKTEEFNKSKQKITSSKITSKNETNDKQLDDDDGVKRSYHTLVIPSYITVNSTSPIYKCQLCNKTFNTKWHIKYHQYCNGGKQTF